MFKFPSQFLYSLIYFFFSFNLSGCDKPLPIEPPMPFITHAQPTAVPAAPESEKVEEVILDPLTINGHESFDPMGLIDVVSEDSEEAACKVAGGFLVVPQLSASGIYLNCGDQRDAVYYMKLVNCTKEKIGFAMFAFTIRVSLNQETALKGALADEFIRFELHVDNDHSSYLGEFKSVDSKIATISVEDLAVELEAGEKQFCRLKAIRRCSDNGDGLEVNLDLTGASASKVEEGGKPVKGAVFDKPDRQVTFMSRD